MAGSRERAAVTGCVRRLDLLCRNLGHLSAVPGTGVPFGDQSVTLPPERLQSSGLRGQAGKGVPFQSHPLAVLRLVSIFTAPSDLKKMSPEMLKVNCKSSWGLRKCVPPLD